MRRLWPLLVVGMIAVLLRLASGGVSRRTYDERVYMAYATQIAESGIVGTRALVNDYNADQSKWIYPLPTRVGYYYVLAVVMKLFGVSAESAGRAVSCVFSIFGFFVAAVIGLRFFNRWMVLSGLTLMSVCPMDLAIARRVWQDGVWACVGLLLFYLCLEASQNSRRKAWLVSYWAVSGYFLLIKESSAVVYALCTLWLVGSVWLVERSFKRCAGIALISVLPCALSFALLSRLAGGVTPFVEVLRHAAQAVVTNEYAHAFQNGPWYSFVAGFWALSPVATLLGLVGIAVSILPRCPLADVLELDDRQRRVTRTMVFLIAAVIAIATLPSGFKNLRYVTIIYGPFYLMSGLGIGYLFVLVRKLLREAAARILVAAICVFLAAVAVTDYANFHRVFVRYELNDLAIPRVIKYSKGAGAAAVGPLSAP